MRKFLICAVILALAVLFLASCKTQEDVAGKAGEAATACSDEDGGKVYNVPAIASGVAAAVNTPTRIGVVAGNVYELTDKCTADKTSVKELYCNENNKLAEEIYNCGALGCEKGACKTPTCSDTDGGNDPYVAGTRTKGAETKTDYCIDSTKVMEYTCEPYQGAGITCPTGKCEEGACVCNDSDGEDYTVKGTSIGKDSTGTLVTKTDSCSGATLTEWYCENNILKSKTVTCDGNCQDGKCTKCKAGNIKYEGGNCAEGTNKWTCRGGTGYKCSAEGIWVTI